MENFVLIISDMRVQGQIAQRINLILGSIPSESRELIELFSFAPLGLRQANWIYYKTYILANNINSFQIFLTNIQRPPKTEKL